MVDIVPRQAIHIADGLGRTLVSWASERDDLRLVSRLTARGANPDATDREGNTAIHHAVYADSRDCIEFLLGDAGANPSAGNIYGHGRLRYAQSLEVTHCFQKYTYAIEEEGQKSSSMADAAASLNYPLSVVDAMLSAGPSWFLELLEETIHFRTHGIQKVMLTRPENLVRASQYDGNLSLLAAQFGTIEALKLLATFWTGPLECRLNWERDNTSVQEWARFRRDKNNKCARMHYVPADDDPLAWFKPARRWCLFSAPERSIRKWLWRLSNLTDIHIGVRVRTAQATNIRMMMIVMAR